MTNINVSKHFPPSLTGRAGEGLLSGSLLLLTRSLSNLTCTMGTLVSDDGELNLTTKEGRLLKDGTNYVTWLLPPGDYRLRIVRSVVNIGGQTMRAYYPEFERVAWFPQAGFYASKDIMAVKGRILLGMSAQSEFELADETEALKHLLRYTKRMHDEGKQTVILRIVENRDLMTFNDYSLQDVMAQNMADEEKRRQEEMEREIFGKSL